MINLIIEILNQVHNLGHQTSIPEVGVGLLVSCESENSATSFMPLHYLVFPASFYGQMNPISQYTFK
jgi:hypothetical protein